MKTQHLLTLISSVIFLGVAAPLLTAQTLAGTGSDQTPLFETTNLFEAGQSGYTTFRIPSMLATRRGTIMLACAGRSGGSGDWANIDTMLSRSPDGGKTWEPARVLTDVGTNVVDNATLFADGDRVFLMYQVQYAKAYLKTSDDEGVTWSEPREITSAFETYRRRDKFDWKILAMGPGHGIVLKSGRIVVPIWLATSHSHRPSITSTVYSDDKGATWQAGDIVTTNLPESKNPSENVCIELVDGRVMDNIRCESPTHCRLVACSPDGATQWTTPKPDKHLFDPICFASMARFSMTPASSKNRILFCNPDSEGAEVLTNTKTKFIVRKNVTVRLSYDEGATWPISKVVEPGDSGYTDLAVAPDGTIFLAYERGGTAGEKVFSSKYINVARFNLAWLTAGSDAGQ